MVSWKFFSRKLKKILEKAQKYDGFGEMAKNWKNKFDWLEIQLKNYRQEFIRKSSK